MSVGNVAHHSLELIGIFSTERRHPQVVNCPESFNVQLDGHETSRSVYWVEPNFETDSEIKQLYKSHTPGQVLIAGVHYVNYVATDANGLSAKCSFGITVKGKTCSMC